MYLHSKLEDYKGNINIAFIGCGKFISMFLSQYNQLKKIKIDTIVDLDIERAKSNCIKSGLTKETVEKINFVNSLDTILNRNIEIFIEAPVTNELNIFGFMPAFFASSDVIP